MSIQNGCNGFYPTSKLSIEDARAIITETLDKLEEPNGVYNLAVQEASNDMLKYMRVVFPRVMKIQMSVLSRHGYNSDGEDLVKFHQLVKDYEKHDEELSRINSKLRALLLPHMDVIKPASNSHRFI